MTMSKARSCISPPKLSRRRVLGLLSAAGAAGLTGARIVKAQTEEHAGAMVDTLDCVVTPAQTAGPYFVDEQLNRADIRLDPITNEMKEGLPLRLRVNVARVECNACAPIEGAVVDVWQCDALGVYPDVRDFQGRFDTRGRRFLRGYQVTNRHGATEFVTVYPGWYSGRTVHIHFKIRVPGGDGRNDELTSQLYFDDAITEQVLAQAPYNQKGRRSTRNERDGLYRRAGSQLLLRVTPAERGYVGTFNVGLRTG